MNAMARERAETPGRAAANIRSIQTAGVRRVSSKRGQAHPQSVVQRELERRLNQGPLKARLAVLRTQLNGSRSGASPARAKLTPGEAALNQMGEMLAARAAPVQRQENRTGLPDDLKSGLETLSQLDLTAIRVFRNSPKPAQLNAHAFAQGPDIHLAPGQEQHLPHEGWHVVQQLQGRVKPTTRFGGVSINADPALEREADQMGRRAARVNSGWTPLAAVQRRAQSSRSAELMDRVTPLSMKAALEAPRPVPGSAWRRSAHSGLWKPSMRLVPAGAGAFQFAGPLIQPAFLSGTGVVQLDGNWTDVLKNLFGKLWELIKKAHTTKVLPAILYVLDVMTVAIRYALEDDSVGAQFGTGLLALATGIEAAVTAVEEWRAATGTSKEVADKRASALEKLVTVLVLIASTIGIPIDPKVGAFISAVGLGSVKILRGAYDIFAQWYWGGGTEEEVGLL